MQTSPGELVSLAVEGHVTPGACLVIGRRGSVLIASLGHHTYDLSSPRCDPSTLWDLASLTKVVCTTTLAMCLFEQGRLLLDTPVRDVLPQAKTDALLRNLLLHDAGYPAGFPLEPLLAAPERAMQLIVESPPEREPGEETVYSDVGFIILGAALEAIGGGSLDALFRRLVAGPLGMTETCFNPSSELAARCAPTEAIEGWRAARTGGKVNGWIQGQVHDPRAAALGGIAGHAGLFSTARDLVRFAEWMVSGTAGRLATAPLPASSRRTVELFTARASSKSSRALGWDTPEPGSSGESFAPRAFGHTGFTGTSIWCDPDAEGFVILLTNRVHPTAGSQAIKDLRREVHAAVAALWHGSQ